MSGPKVKKSDIIKRKTFGIFSHYGIVNEVNENGNPISLYEYNGANKLNSKIQISSLEKFLDNADRYEIEQIQNKEVYSESETLERASKDLDSKLGGYNVFYNNCEHWAKFIKLKDPSFYELNSLTYSAIIIVIYIIVVLIYLLGISIKVMINIIFYISLSCLVLFLSTNKNF